MGGVCFLSPAVQRGQKAVLRVSLDNKPGRMRYFLGVARDVFATDASDVELRRAGWSLENLYGGLHREGSPWNGKSLPCFHTGSILTLALDYRNPKCASLTIFVDSSQKEFKTEIQASTLQNLVFWISLYNRFAQFSILDD